MLEKSGCLQLTQEQVDLIRSRQFSTFLPLLEAWGLSSTNELKALVDSGEYRLLDQTN